MKICTQCLKEKELTDFYQVKQTSGKYNYRAKCKECFISKQLNNYYIKVGRKGKYRLAFCTECNEWKEKTQHFAFDVTTCNSCIKNDLEPIVEPIVEIVEEHTEETISPEFTPLELEIELSYRICRKCGEQKDKSTGFYSKGGTICKDCTKERERITRHNHDRERNEMYGGSERVKPFPNEYTDEWQRKHVFTVLQAIGWKFNEENNIWYDDKIKTKDGVFITIEAQAPQPKVKKKFASTNTDRLEEIKYNNIETIISLREQGYFLKDLAEQFKVSRPTLSKWIGEYKKS